MAGEKVVVEVGEVELRISITLPTRTASAPIGVRSKQLHLTYIPAIFQATSKLLTIFKVFSVCTLALIDLRSETHDVCYQSRLLRGSSCEDSTSRTILRYGSY